MRNFVITVQIVKKNEYHSRYVENSVSTRFRCPCG